MSINRRTAPVRHPIFHLPLAVGTLNGDSAVVVDACSRRWRDGIVRARPPSQRQREQHRQHADHDPARPAVKAGGAGHGTVI